MSKAEAKTNGTPAKVETKPKCGIVMPISPIDGLSGEHWAEVLGILKDVINSIDFEPNLVSDADDIGIIQKRIIHNLYNNEIVVCDVSAKNPNVMFELGMRLAFDKPTIIIKDDKTDYTFDTSVIEHLTYPRDLRFTRIIEFKENLKKKIEGTYKKSKDDPKYSTFLKNFGQYKIAHLQETEVSESEYILSSLTEIKNEITKLKTVEIDLGVTQKNSNNINGMTFDQYMIIHLKTYAETIKVSDLFQLHYHIDDLVKYFQSVKAVKNKYPNEHLMKDKIKSLLPIF